MTLFSFDRRLAMGALVVAAAAMLGACGGGGSGDPVAPAAAPTITAQPASQTVALASSATFSVTASGDAPLSYQWQRAGAEIAGATASTFTLLDVKAADDASVWSVRVSNAAGSVLSAGAVLSIKAKVSLFAGSIDAPGTADGQGAAAGLTTPGGLALDSAGNLFVADTGNHTIRKISPSALVFTFAGVPRDSGGADGVGPAARFSFPAGLAIDGADNLYVVDGFPVVFGLTWTSVRKVTPAAQVSEHFRTSISPPSIAADAAGNVYLTFARKILPDGTETFFNAPAARSAMDGIVVDRNGTIYYGTANTVRRTAPGQPEVILAGSATPGFADGAGDQASFNFSRPGAMRAFGAGMAVDSAGNVYLADPGNHRVRKITPAGIVTTVAGETEVKALTPVALASDLLEPRGLALQGDEILYVTWGHAVLKIELP